MNRTTGGRSVYDLGCYTNHAIRNTLQVDHESIHTHAQVDPQFNVDTDVVSYLTFKGNVRATFTLSFNLPMRHEYRVYGSEGSVVVPRAFRPDLYGGEAIIKIETPSYTRIDTINREQYRMEVDHFSHVTNDGDK